MLPLMSDAYAASCRAADGLRRAAITLSPALRHADDTPLMLIIIDDAIIADAALPPCKMLLRRCHADAAAR